MFLKGFGFCLIFCLTIQIRNFCTGEKSYSTSVASMMELLETEQRLLTILINYEQKLYEKFKIIKSGIEKIRVELRKAQANAETYVSNPVNAFSLIRRMQDDWFNWEKYLTEPIAKDPIEQLRSELKNLPNKNDLIEAVKGLQNIQNAYGLETKDMAKGFFYGSQYNATFSSHDLFTIGQVLLNEDEIVDANEWLGQALEAYEETQLQKVTKFDLAQILAVYAESFLRLNDIKNASRALEKAIDLEPENVALHERKAEVERLSLKAKPFSLKTKRRKEKSSTYYGCGRGEFPDRPYPFRCHYNRETSDFLKLAPIKMEQISLDPYMVLYYDVISDDEIEHLKNLSRHHLERAGIYNRDEQKDEPASYRTAKHCQIPNYMSQTALRLHQRTEDMAGFNVLNSNAMTIINYGIGGEYMTHYDYFNLPKNDPYLEGSGDRKTTVIYYLSDVEQGGATIFPEMKVAIFPQKGTALMWHNLDNGNSPDERTFHGGCPVISGSKWILTKWIHEYDQLRNSTLRPKIWRNSY